jgi:hypothetical protein
MKILRRGDPVRLTVYFWCSKCNCRFEADKDTEAKWISDVRGDGYWSHTCPTEYCGAVCTNSRRDGMPPEGGFHR